MSLVRYNGSPRPNGSRKPDPGGARQFFGVAMKQGSVWPFNEPQTRQLLYTLNKGESRFTGKVSADDPYPVFETIAPLADEPTSQTSTAYAESESDAPAKPKRPRSRKKKIEPPTTSEPSDTTPGDNAGQGA